MCIPSSTPPIILTVSALLPAKSLCVDRLPAMSGHILGRPLLPPQNCPLRVGIWTPISYMFSRANPSLHPKMHLNRLGLFAQLTAGGPYTLQWAAQFPPQYCPFAWSDLDSYLIMIPLANSSPHPKRHLDRFSRFCRVHGRDRQTDRPTEHVTPSATKSRN